MAGKTRALRMAILSSIGLILFAFTFIVTGNDLYKSWNAPDGGDLGVTYTFDTYTCWTAAPGSTDTKCVWHGTVSLDGKIQAKDVVYEDVAPEDAQPGTKIYALWTASDPQVAWNLESARAWLNTIGSTILAGIGTLAMLLLTAYWWRQFGKESAKAAAQPPNRPKPATPEKELSHSSS